MKKILIVGTMLSLAACGGANRFEGGARRPAPVYAPMATGPINSACIASDRKARSSQLCGCIQAVANQTLTRSDQVRAVKFYSNPQAAQDIRQSSRSSDERFWEAYSNYSNLAVRICT